MSQLSLAIDPHPLLDLSAFVTVFPTPLEAAPSPDWLRALLLPDAAAPLAPDEPTRTAVRALLRYGGFKPSGRAKPACEYLVRAAQEGGIDVINAAVDACNAVSLHAGLPISVVDLDRAQQPLRVAIAPAGARYVFNPAGQEMDLEGLLCLWDAEGPCANAVKDAQRTKTHGETTRTLSLVWGTGAAPGRSVRTASWYREILERLGATTEVVV